MRTKGIHLTSLYINKERSRFTKYHHAARTSCQIMQECAKKMIPETCGERRGKGREMEAEWRGGRRRGGGWVVEP